MSKILAPLAASLALGVWAFGVHCPAIEQPPPLPPPVASAANPPLVDPPGCRCDILERKLDALIELLIRKGVIDSLDALDSRDEEGGGTSMRPAAGIATPPVLTAPLVLLPGTQQLGHGPYMSKAYKFGSAGRWWSYKRCQGSYCTMEYYWVPK